MLRAADIQVRYVIAQDDSVFTIDAPTRSLRVPFRLQAFKLSGVTRGEERVFSISCFSFTSCIGSFTLVRVRPTEVHDSGPMGRHLLWSIAWSHNFPPVTVAQIIDLGFDTSHIFMSELAIHIAHSR